MCVLGIDLGTASTKAAVVDHAGRVRGAGAADHAVMRPAPGAAESDPADWLTSVAQATHTALDAAGHPHVDAVGLSGQMHGVVCSDADAAPLAPAMLWPDARATAACQRYRRLPPAARRALANPIVPGMFGPLLATALAGSPDLRRTLRWALSPKDWLRAVLTGGIATEPSDASATLLWDAEASDWSRPALDALDVSDRVLAPLVASDAVAATLNTRGAQLLGLPAGTPVAAGAGDTAAAIVGSRLPAGHTQLSVGTGAQVVVAVDAPHLVDDPVVHRYRRADGDGWYAMAAIQNAGLALEWVREVMRADWDEVHAALDAVGPGADGVTFHGYLTGERTPVLDADVRGAWQGLSLHQQRPALLRAALEGVAFAIRDGAAALQREGIDPGPVWLLGGGTADPRWRMLLAGTLNRPLTVHRLADVSVLGAARLAAAAVDRDLPPAHNRDAARVEPPTELVARLDDAWQRWRARRP